MKSCAVMMNEYKELLSELGINMTPELEKWILDTYPDEDTIENHIRTIILTHLHMEE